MKITWDEDDLYLGMAFADVLGNAFLVIEDFKQNEMVLVSLESHRIVSSSTTETIQFLNSNDFNEMEA